MVNKFLKKINIKIKGYSGINPKFQTDFQKKILEKMKYNNNGYLLINVSGIGKTFNLFMNASKEFTIYCGNKVYKEDTLIFDKTMKNLIENINKLPEEKIEIGTRNELYIFYFSR